ncbi:hypothetical protein N7456_008212 [Penicillium angulare]|uniref:Uncharacterized protein n=1 Tax=Penicillium angulare TaxID=116970 RepID=A0A9W9FC38_9EURO|nr:hypothetical protein N7456_008212 [Penicillium angulare]
MLQLGTAESVPIHLDGNVFTSWIGTLEETAPEDTLSGPNYLGILTLGWCYVLSAYLVELRGEGSSMEYTEHRAKYNASMQNYPGAHLIEIGSVSEDTARWWSAILASGEGWKSLVFRGTEDYLAPWSIKRACATQFFTRYESISPSSTPAPLSAKQAFDALAEFAHVNKLGSQFSIALATALTIPSHRYLDSSIRLPFPTMTSRKYTGSVGPIPSTWLRLFEDLSYYISLSCNAELMVSTFCGSFWEPGVPCNLVAPWLHPVINEILGVLPIESGSAQEILALMCAIRRPKFSAFWMGAAISGLCPKIMKRVQGGSPPLDPNGFAWTGCPQGFMDIPGSGPYLCEDSSHIQRQDVWRLLHLPTDENDDLGFGRQPFTPWAPCGASPTMNCALRVRKHLECRRHEYQYDYWNWELEDGEVIKDYGFSRSLPHSEPKVFYNNCYEAVLMDIKEKEFDFDQKVSESASWEIFQYFFVNGEGLPSEKIYYDSWIKDTWEHESDMEPEKAGVEKPKEDENKLQDRISSWLDSLS